MHESLVEILQCPACRGDLCWTVMERDGDVLLEADASCRDCGATYHVREGIGAFLTPDLQRTDLWQERHRQLTEYLIAHPDVRSKLIDGPLEELEPVDRLLRAEYLEDLGDVEGAEEAGRGAREQLHTPELSDLWNECLEHMVQISSGQPGPLVDVASERGLLVELLAEQGSPLIVATDINLRALRRARRPLQQKGLADRVSHLVVDVRKMPFCDQGVPAILSHMGLASVLEGELDALSELRRVCSGALLFSHMFYGSDAPGRVLKSRDASHRLAILPDTMEALDSAGWDAEILVNRRVPVKPMPASKLVPGMIVDRFPLADVELDGVLVIAC